MSEGLTAKHMAGNIASHIIGIAERGEKPSLSAFDFSYAMAVMTGFHKEICLDMIMEEQARIRSNMEAVK